MESIISFVLQRKIVLPILIVCTTILIVRVGKVIVRKLFTRGKDNFEAKKRTTIVELISKILSFFVYAIAIIMILDIYGVDTNGILASLGIAGVVLGLALQDTVQDLMSGIYIILDNYFVIGDTVRIDNFTGEVVELLR